MAASISYRTAASACRAAWCRQRVIEFSLAKNGQRAGSEMRPTRKDSSCVMLWLIPKPMGDKHMLPSICAPADGSTPAESKAGFGEHAKLLARNVEWNVAEATLACEQQSFRRKIFERGLHALTDSFRRFNRVTALIDDTESEVAFEVPQSPQIHEVVAKRAMLE